jgi:putative ABC transport system permease protein
VIIAFIIAAPVAWYVIHKWLDNFVYKIPVQWWVFLVAGIATLVIAFITISLQAIRTAITNPVKNLRAE